ncbi:MAG: hypothetical protein GX580_08400 [Candidatus Hydrogenedens sp.]|nr:hypothetical protein [Candidatus Hydrogenedens sp.]
MLSLAQRDMVARYLRAESGEFMVFANPGPEYLWTRYQVFKGALAPDFNAADLVRLALERGGGRVKLTTEAMDWARRAGLLASDLPEVAAPVAGDAAAVPPPGQKTTKRTLAEELGVMAWHELEVACGLDGLRFKRCGAPGRGRLVKWYTFGGGEIIRGLLRDLAVAPPEGMANPNNERHRGRVKMLRKRLRGAVGLDENPVENVAGTWTRCAFQISWTDEPTKQHPGGVAMREEDGVDKWALDYDGDE